MNKERVRQILRGISGLLSLVILFLLFLRVCGRIQRGLGQQELNNQFSYAESGVSEYQENVPMEEINFDRIERICFYNLLGGGQSEKEVPIVVKAPCPIRYYRNDVGRKVLEKEIPQGTPLYICLENWGEPIIGYGNISYPTYEKGWRWVRPFLTAEEADIQEEEDMEPLSQEEKEKALEAPYYYVKLDDLLAVEWAAYDQNDFIRQEYQNTVSQDSMGRSLEEVLYNQVIFADQRMRSMGIYCSQDMELPLWRWEDTVYVIFFWVAVFFAVFVFRKRKPKPAPEPKP